MIRYAILFVKSAVLPPFSLLLLALAGIIVCRGRPRLARGLILAALGLLYVFSTPIFGIHALSWLEKPYADPVSVADARAIVVLSAGVNFDAPEYGADTVDRLSLQRVRYAAFLHQRTGKPILVAGGSPVPGRPPVAKAMAAVLVNEFHCPVRWIEDRSLTTWENAKNSFAILNPAGVHTIYLVTSAWHMPRAAWVFRRFGFTVVEAPTGFHIPQPLDPLSFVPEAGALLKSYYFFHEAIGCLWYRLRAY
jgi:uncharacterized SAM-binding protein YcdF (DUF218 family)